MIYPTVHNATNYADRPAILTGESVITHSEFEKRILADAERLVALGMGPGDRVALCAANSVDWVIAAHAVVRAQGNLVPLSTRMTALELRERLLLLLPRLVLADGDSVHQLLASHDNAFPVYQVGESSDAGIEAPRLSEVCPRAGHVADEYDPGAVCTIVATSGSSGDPKGVCLTLGNHLASAEASHANLECGLDDCWLINLPLYHIGGLAIVFRAAHCGFPIRVHHGFDAEATLRAVRSENVTLLSLVETTLARLLDSNGDAPFPDTLRAALIGGGPVDAELLQRARALGMNALLTYGLTEAASQVATQSLTASKVQLVSGGARPLPSCDVEVRDADGSPLSAGNEGEIWLHGPLVAAGYWSNTGAVVPCTEDDWLCTGDMGIFDAEGYLSVTGRKDDMIISGGENIHPAEIERVLMRLPGIRRAAVIGVTDAEWGQRPVALVEPAAGRRGDPTQWLRKLRERVAGYKVPKSIVVVEELPLTAIGKIDRTRLRAIYDSRKATEAS
jgi:O-succinylbenzoic acid--CoA ligase